MEENTHQKKYRKPSKKQIEATLKYLQDLVKQEDEYYHP